MTGVQTCALPIYIEAGREYLLGALRIRNRVTAATVQACRGCSGTTIIEFEKADFWSIISGELRLVLDQQTPSSRAIWIGEDDSTPTHPWTWGAVKSIYR